jgi:Na+-transporting NADH:ubiquinone oxidoreductase subunit C
MARDSVGHTLAVATILCVVCSVLVASAAVGLRSRQEANKKQDQMKNVLLAAGLFDAKENRADEVNSIFEERIERVLIDLETGELADSSVVDPETYDQREAARKPGLSAPVQPANGLGGIKKREKFSFVYQVKDDTGQIEQVVLPIYGKGLWSTLYGFLAVDSDAKTVRGITFYQHGETPGLGGEIDNSNWKALWVGKQLFDEQGEIAIEVVKGVVVEGTEKTQYQIDGLSGATITSNGVSQLVRYWVGSDGFGPFLEKLRQSAPGDIDG